MSDQIRVSTVEAPAEPTLATVLTQAVRTAVPTRLYQILQLALPLAADFAYRGWWRPAGWAIAVAAFGAWGLADRWLWNAAEEGRPEEGRLAEWQTRLARLSRGVCGTVAAALLGILALELFLRLLGNAPIS